MTGLVAVEDLWVTLDRPGGGAILGAIGLTLDAGQTLGIVGESGCGKSTLLAALMGDPGRGLVARGRVRLGGTEVLAAPAETLRRLRGGVVALVPQNAAVTLTPSMTVGGHLEEQLALKTDLGRRARADRAAELVAAVGLQNPAAILARYPHQLSGGQQQRIAIALALAGGPSVLLLDEPTTALDVTTKGAILDLLAGIGARERLTMIYVSHDIGVIRRMSDRVGVMYAGELVEDGPARAVLETPAHPYTRGLLASIPRLDDPFLPRAMPGRPPALAEPRPGCAFAPRCPSADALCHEVRPQARPAGAQKVACHRPLAGAVNPRPPRPAAFLPVAPRPEAPLLQLDGVEIAWHQTGLADRLRGRRPPPTVSGIDLALAPGEALGLIGESGSGKSTILRAIAGLWPLRAGRMAFDGRPLAPAILARDAAARRHIQMIFQNPEDSLNPRHSLREILARPLAWFHGLTGAARETEVRRLIEAVRLPQSHLDRRPADLSGGERQRVAIARALAARPKLLLCDEITSALDVSVQAAILELLADLRRETGVALLFVSHDLAVVRHLADRLVILCAGRVCESGPTGQVLAHPSHDHTAALLRSAGGWAAGAATPA